jgi:hypothetical protein
MRIRMSAILWLLIVLACLSVGCTKTEISDPMIEDGVVAQTIFRPYHAHSSVVPVTYIDSNGSVSVTLETRTECYPNEYWVVFACQHGQFAVEDKKTWDIVRPGMRVKIKYRQIDEYMEKDKSKVHMSTGYDFISAWPVDVEWNEDETARGVAQLGQ